MTTSTFFPTVAGVRVTFPTLPLSPGQLHTFTSRSLEARVFTHRSAAIMTTTYADFSHAAGGTRNGRWRDDNEHLEFIGDMVLKGLTGMLIEDLHPDADEGYMSALTTVILSNRFYAHMSRTLGLNSRLRLHNANYNGTLETERVLGGLFEAYIAGVYKEYGNARFAELYVWFAGWMRPYFVAISSQITESKRPVLFPTAFPSSTSTANPSSTSTSRLHEYVAAHRLPQPQYRFVQVEWLEWTCFVKLGDKEVRGKPMARKNLAKDEGCKVALEYLMNT